MKPNFTLRDLFWLMLVIALVIMLVQEKANHAGTQAAVAQTNGSWIIAIGDLPAADWDAVRERQAEAFQHLRSGK